MGLEKRRSWSCEHEGTLADHPAPCSRGFSLDIGKTMGLRRLSHNWFQDTALAFKREAAHATIPAVSEAGAQQQQAFITSRPRNDV
mmetsp:Transcript_23072/g.52993  ORF Transcript_23072/g.52993 Transcript_23072/m.52993 type:complete len:86 (+) Transcript_23072:352-609(+)